MSALWDPQQREWLQAMGYRVWRLGGEEPPPALEDEAAPVAAPAPAREVAADRVPPVAGPKPPPAPPTLADPAEPVADRRPSSPTPTGAERRLYRALLRATGQRTTRAAEALVAQLQVDLPAMRDDPAAKRALWPRLRALRKASERR